MSTTRLCWGAVETWDEIETRSCDGPIVDGRSVFSLARPNGGDVTLWDWHQPLACYACLLLSTRCRFVWYRLLLILDDQPTRAHTDCAPSTSPSLGNVLHLMFAVSAIEASHDLEFTSKTAFNLVVPGETPNKVELKHFLNVFQDTMDQKPYGAMLRGKLPYAALLLVPRNLDDTPPIGDAASGSEATRAALRAQAEHENTIKARS
eukprot:6177121-Pleurochrysis_carterae.AAC.3